jgi:toxin FitB
LVEYGFEPARHRPVANDATGACDRDEPRWRPLHGRVVDANTIERANRLGEEPERKVESFVAAQPLDRLYVSSVTFAEIRFGIELVTDATRRAALQDWLTHKVRPTFDQRILEITEDVMLKWRLLVEEGCKHGHTYSQPDLIIGATALTHGLTVVSRDKADYLRAGVPVFNPWTDPVP